MPFRLTDSRVLGQWSYRQVNRVGKGSKFVAFMLNEKMFSSKYVVTGFSNCVALIMMSYTAGLCGNDSFHVEQGDPF